VLNESFLHPITPQVAPESETGTSYSKINSKVIYEDVAEYNPKTKTDSNYILTECPAYESQPLPRVEGPRTYLW